MNNEISATIASGKQSQIDELLERQYWHIDQLEDIVRRTAEAFGPALQPELCAKNVSECVPQPCRSPIGNRLHGHNERLYNICSGLESLIARSAM